MMLANRFSRRYNKRQIIQEKDRKAMCSWGQHGSTGAIASRRWPGALLFALVALPLLAVIPSHAAQTASLQIEVDQVGYPAGAPKLALVTAPGRKFSVRRASDGAR